MEAWEEAFLRDDLLNMPEEQRELYLKCKALAQPYIDRMNPDLWAELVEKITALTWEYQKARQR